MSPRVVIDARKLGDGGIGVYTQNFINALYSSGIFEVCLLYTSPSPRDKRQSRMPSSA